MLVKQNNLFRNLKPLLLRVTYSSNESDKNSPLTELITDLKDNFKRDYERIKKFVRDPVGNPLNKPVLPTMHVDILIIGGGAIGSSIAYWIKQRTRGGANVAVVEKDLTVKSNYLSSLTYEQASTTLSVGGIRQQFSLKENILLSSFGAEFLRNVNEHLRVPGDDPVDVGFTPNGYLVLASAAGVEQLKENHILQRQLGCKNELLTPFQMKQRFPWLNTDGIELGCLGLKDEGWFDPWRLLTAFQKKAISLGAEFIDGEVIRFIKEQKHTLLVEGFEMGEYIGTNQVEIRLSNGDIRTLQFGFCVLATGADTGKVASDLLDIKKGNEGYYGLEIPIERRKRYVYCFTAPGGPGVCSPMVVDPSGVYFRREGLTDNYICGRSPPYELEPETNDLTVDREYFNDYIWPILAERVPAFEQIRMKSSWAGYYDYNTFDQNLIFGNHPAYYNVHLAAGCSGHGIQHAPAIGKAVMEYFIDSRFSTVEMKPYSFDRIVLCEPFLEKEII